MNNDLISREALKKKLQARHDNGEEDFDKGYNIGIETAIELLDNATTVEYTFEEAFQKAVCEQRLYCPARPQGDLADEVWKLYEKHQSHLATYVIEFGNELKELLGKYQKGGVE